ncbi:DUF2330 domain-containing protein [Thalassococcus lentus]|uniref:DUF2330 domain-containing protein n=1 Tax=Thalassococcus lentus TaxID=1210524 RepID=A0ABT4XP32_9RHOB|nr:DUF2330 domain-containing protein [Thalassococcus lentus]MDA7423662.1 DUF2330 domain-containing protein [Thalassococcus lentus]
MGIWAQSAAAFCGFYVAKADGDLFNQASKVVYFREGNLSVITMASDYRGNPSDFALVIPTPTVLKRPQIKTVDKEVIAHLDAFSAPRLVEYHDASPCRDPNMEVVVEEAATTRLFRKQQQPTQAQRARAKGVTIAAKYAVGAYDILILKAEQSDGLTTFLTEEGYKLPKGAEPVLADYIKMGMKFFVARVNLSRHAKGETQELPPLQIRFRSDDFMLPIQLGKLNGDGAQDALFFMLSRKGRVEPVNYKVAEIPTNVDVPLFVEERFGEFYKRVLDKALPRRGGILLEYGWDMGWCDPCAADPLNGREMRALGVTGLTGKEELVRDIYVTRLHARYSKGQMKKDIQFRATDNRRNFQGRYIMWHPFDGDLNCGGKEEYQASAKAYILRTRKRLQSEARQLRKMTGWPMSSINARINETVQAAYHQ